MALLTLFQIMCFTCYLQFQINIVSSQITKSVTITPNSNTPNISVILGPGATIISNIWNINVTTQQSTDLHVILGSEWGFNPTYNSTISLMIYGSTSTNTLNTDGEIIFIFNVKDKYFAQLKSLETTNEIYKQCPNQNEALISTTNMSQIVNNKPLTMTNRYDRYCPLTWQNIINNYNNPLTWPIWLTIRNDPINNLIDYSYGDFHNQPGDKITNIHFTSSFQPNEGLHFHISGDKINENFNISSIAVTYSYLATDTPTKSPTISPTTSNPTTHLPTTNEPTNIPTITPTITPSIITKMPSITPTYIPTVFPTFIPTIVPTNIPTIVPTFMPSINPTLNPITISPTVTPTFMPTRRPSENIVVEFPSTTNDIITSALKSTIFETIENNSAMNNNNKNPFIILNLAQSFMLISGLLLFGIGCFVVGICFGISFYKKRLNCSNNNNNFNRFDKKGPEIEKQMSNLMMTDDTININKTENTFNCDKESLFATESNIFDNKSIQTSIAIKSKKKGHIIVESDSKILPPIPRQTEKNGEIQFQSQNIINNRFENNPPQISLQVPPNENYKIIHQNHNKKSSVLSVNYLDAHIDEKENKINKINQNKTRQTIGNNYFPDDITVENENINVIEGLSIQKSNEKSIGGYSSLSNDEYYNSDPNQDEDEKYIQNEVTLGIEIEMQNHQTNGNGNNENINPNNIKKIKARNKQEAEHFKMLEKIMLDESCVGSIDYEESDNISNIGPLPASNSLNMDYSKSGTLFIPSINKSKLSSHISQKSNQSCKTFITHIFEEKKEDIDDIDDDDDDDQLNDPEYEQQIQLKLQQQQ